MNKNKNYEYHILSGGNGTCPEGRIFIIKDMNELTEIEIEIINEGKSFIRIIEITDNNECTHCIELLEGEE